MASSRCIAVVCLALTAGPLLASAARQLKERVGRETWRDDPSGYNAFAAARVFDQHAGKFPRHADTTEDAEDLTNPRFTGIYRLANRKDNKVSFATVEPNAVHDNPDRAKMTITPAARSAQDVAGREVDVQGGQAQIPVIAMGNAAVAQTFEGATAAAASDSVITNIGPSNKRHHGTVIARDMVTSNATPIPGRVNRLGSFATGTSEPIKSLALSGAADGKIVLAQAETAVAMSQAGRSRSDSWQMDGTPGRAWRERNGA